MSDYKLEAEGAAAGKGGGGKEGAEREGRRGEERIIRHAAVPSAHGTAVFKHPHTHTKMAFPSLPASFSASCGQKLGQKQR